MIAARLLVELGVGPADAFARVRLARPTAFDTKAQIAHSLAAKKIDPELDAQAARIDPAGDRQTTAEGVRDEAGQNGRDVHPAPPDAATRRQPRPSTATPLVASKPVG